VSLRRLIAKVDPVERDRRNRALGRAGEEFVIDLERRQLTGIGRTDLARNVRWIADEEGDGAVALQSIPRMGRDITPGPENSSISYLSDVSKTRFISVRGKIRSSVRNSESTIAFHKTRQ
jgi:hypothetical protein